MQDLLFEDEEAAPPAKPTSATAHAHKAGTATKPSTKVAAAASVPALIELARALPAQLRLGTSSWGYSGWAQLVWDKEYPDATLSRFGLPAYSQHPLLRAVSIDRTFYQPLDAMRLAHYGAQVGADFRFTVKAPALLTDSLLRDEEGKGLRPNPYFLDAQHAARVFIEPLLQGLGNKLGAAVFQFSPLPLYWLERMPTLIERLQVFLQALPSLHAVAPAAVIAVEVRNRQWLTAEFAKALKAAGATYCLGLHGKMPRITEQLPTLRALWPGPLVCRWNMHTLHGAYGYEQALAHYAPFDKLVDPDVETRRELARVIQGVTGAGHNAFVTISNEAEGSAPLSVIELAKAVVNKG